MSVVLGRSQRLAEARKLRVSPTLSRRLFGLSRAVEQKDERRSRQNALSRQRIPDKTRCGAVYAMIIQATSIRVYKASLVFVIHSQSGKRNEAPISHFALALQGVLFIRVTKVLCICKSRKEGRALLSSSLMIQFMWPGKLNFM